MTPCDRVETERLIDADELDAAAREHVAGCAPCEARLAGYRRIAGALRALGASHAVPADRRERLLATIDALPAEAPRDRIAFADRRSARRWRTHAVAAVGLAAAAVLALWLTSDRAPVAPRFELAVLAGTGEPTRGDARLGERLRVRARLGSSIGIRIYRNDRELLLECPRGCTRDGGVMIGEITLDAIARYQIVWFDGPLPPSAGELDRDVAAAAAAGARYELRELEVR